MSMSAVRAGAASRWGLAALLTAADPQASRTERHVWLYRLVQWLREPDRRAEAPGDRLGAGLDEGGDTGTLDAPPAGSARTPLPALRLRHFTQVLERNPSEGARVGALLQRLVQETDSVSVLADHGFSAREGLLGEVLRRIGRRVLPHTPDTADLAELLALLAPVAADADWIAALDGPTLDRLAALIRATAEATPSAAPSPAPSEAAAAMQPDQAAASRVPLAVVDAVSILASAVHTAGLSPAMRLRMSADLLADRPFQQLARASDAWCDAVRAGDVAAAAREAQWLHALLERCRACADSVQDHLADHGVSVSLVYEIDQLKRRTLRIADLMALAMALLPEAGATEWHGPLRHLLGELVRTAEAGRSVRALLGEHSALLARKMAERHAATGEHYITRTRAEYAWMLKAAAGGGAVLAGTTFAKFAILSVGLGVLWAGFWSGVNYAVSFLIVMALHFTVATKQPAMTAPALASRLHDLGDEAGVERFIDEVAHLIRSQVAGIAGNLCVVAPVVLAFQGLAWWLAGRPLLDEAHAQHVLHSLTLLGPTALFAAFTGVLLFASSLVAGWAENAFVWHRLDSALAHNPRIVDRLGAERARRWAAWWRANISGVAANVSLGLMLGLVPAILQIVGLPMEVRHVTLSTGQLAAAVGTLGTPLLAMSIFGWCLAGILVTGALNLGVSFSLAFAVALRARGLHVRGRDRDRQRIRAGLWRRLRERPASFLWPPKEDTAAGAAG